MPARLFLALAGLSWLASAAPPARAEDVTSDYRISGQALQQLVSSPLGRTLPALPWKVEILESWFVNAYSNGRGRISITRGLAFNLGDHPGVWAAAIAHELGHVVSAYPAGQPAFEAELRRAYLAAGGSLSDPDAEWALQVTPGVHSAFNLGGKRRTEYEADRLGLLLMAEAGFHPDFAIALDRRMRSTMGDQSKYSEFLLNHPLWSNREQQTTRAERIALAIFNQRWPDAARSPGGEAPPLGRIVSVTLNQEPVAGVSVGATVMHVSFEIQNAARRQVRVAAILLDDNRKVHTSVPAYRAPDGTLELNSMVPALDRGSAEAALRIPADVVDVRGRKLKAELFLVADDWTLDLWFQPLESASNSREPQP
ncbi:MAG TPA: M48 family metalloprotease [Terriglobia bacterium]